MTKKHMVAIGKIIAAHGLKGLVRMSCDLVDYNDLANYEIYDKNEKKLNISIEGQGKKDSVIISIEGIDKIEDTSNFINQDLFIEREKLPELDEGEYYYHDIIGLEVLSKGEKFGEVQNMCNYGAGEILEIKKIDGKLELFSFTDENFPEIDFANNLIYYKQK